MDDLGDGGGSTRFKPGRGGNPGGRPRKVKPPESASAFAELRERRITIRMNGVDSQFTVEAALLHQTFQEALAGGRMATRTILKIIEEHEAAKAPEHRRLVKVLFECIEPDGVDEALIILGIASRSLDCAQAAGAAVLELEPWAVTAGLKRQKGRQIKNSHLADLKAHTRDAASVVWPSGDE